MSGIQSIFSQKIQPNYETKDKPNSGIQGILLEKKDHTIKLLLDNQQLVEAVLKDPLKEKVGSSVAIDKSQIVTMKPLEESKNIEAIEEDRHAQILQHYGIDVNSESLEIVRRLERLNIPITKETIETLMVAKGYFYRIQKDLTYDVAVKLLHKNIDIENESLQKVAEAIEETKQEKEAFSLLKWLGLKKELTTEDAERVSLQIYGKAMGKDILDIIKTLHKENVSITKKSIEKTYDVFYKLEKIKEVNEDVFVAISKDQMVPNIENLYRIKNHVTEGAIAAKEDGAGSYEQMRVVSKKVGSASKELDENIRALLKEMDLDPTEENLRISKELIRQALPVTKESIEEIAGMKKALEALAVNLDYKKAGELLRQGVEVEKEDLRALARLLEEIQETENMEIEGSLEGQETQKEIEGILSRLDRLKEIKESDLIKLIQRRVDFQLNKIEALVVERNPVEASLEGIVAKQLYKAQEIAAVFQKVKSLGYEKVSSFLARNIPLTLKSIQGNADGMNSGQRIAGVEEGRLQDFARIHGGSFPVAGFHRVMEVGKALLINRLPLNLTNVGRVLDAYGQYGRIRDNLTSRMVLESIEEGKDLMTMDLEVLDGYVAEKGNRVKDEDWHGRLEKNNGMQSITEGKAKGLRRLVEQIQSPQQEKENVLSFLIKHRLNFSLKEIADVSKFYQNQEQLGQKIGEILQITGKIENLEWKEKISKLERLSQEVSEKLKKGDASLEQAYHEFMEHLEYLQHEMSGDQEGHEDVQDRVKEIKDSLAIQKKLGGKNLCLQYPVVLGDQFSNLQVYMRQDQQAGMKNGPLSMLLNLDTKGLGQLGMSVKIHRKEIELSIGVSDSSKKEHLEKLMPSFQLMLQEIGYNLGKTSIYIEEGIYPKNKEEYSGEVAGNGLFTMGI